MSEQVDRKGIEFSLRWLVCAGLSLLVVFTLGVGLGQKLRSDCREDNKNTSENIIYYNDSKRDITIRYKYILGYESTSKLKNENPVYTLYIDNERTAEALASVNLPVVSEPRKLKGNDFAKSDFHIKFNSEIDSEKVRVDIRIVVEELRSGKWTPVHQVIFMERGPYWSLDKGPIEQIQHE